MPEFTGAHDLAYRANAFREGCKRKYEAGPGDMWLFELYHFLGDVEEVLKAAPPLATRRARIGGKLDLAALGEEE